MDYLSYRNTGFNNALSNSWNGSSGHGSNLFPTLPAMQTPNKPFDNYPAPTPLRNSLTSLPWRPTTYYSTGRPSMNHALIQSTPGPCSGRNQPMDVDPIRVPPVFNTGPSPIFTRFTPGDWNAFNQANYSSSEQVRNIGNRVRTDTDRLVRAVDDRTRFTQADVGRRLGDRIGDIHYWETEVNNEISAMIAEIDALVRAKSVLEKNLAESENPLHVSKECMFNREKRQRIDLVHDNVETQLIREVDTIKGTQQEMRRAIQDAVSQLAANRAAQHDLEKDSRDKSGALSLDKNCHQLRNSSRSICFQNGIERIENNVSIPQSWAKFSNDNITRSKRERQVSAEMRSHIQALISRTTNINMTQWTVVNNAFNDRIRESMQAKSNLKSHLSQVQQEIFDMEKNIELLRKCIQDKEAPMMVAQTRLSTRLHRQNVEACRDPVHHRLQSEVHEINDTVSALRHKLTEAENTLQHLLRTKASLEQDLSVKTYSIGIDNEACMGIRRTFPMATNVINY